MIWAIGGALLIGLSLGLMGSGGSILTVPVLTYLVGQEEKVAIASSLAIVGMIALFAGMPYARRGQVDYRSLWLFGLPGMGGSYFGAFLAAFVSGAFQLTLFALLMFPAAALMFRPPATNGGSTTQRTAWKICLEGLVVGALTGFVGVGGGFMIVPALVLFGGLPMSRAVGTSLFIIALKSGAGFIKYLDVLEGLDLELDWSVIGLFAGLGTLGSFAGSAIAKYVPQVALRKGFGVFLLVIGLAIVAKSVVPAQDGPPNAEPVEATDA